MKKLFALISIVMAFFAMSCTSISTSGGNGTVNGLAGTTWTGTDRDGAVITITFTDAVNGSGNVMYGGQQMGTLKFTYTMKDVSNGTGAIVYTQSSGRTEVYSFSLIYIDGVLYVTIPDMSSSAITFSRVNNQGTNPGGSGTNGLAGTSWRYAENAQSDEWVTITFSATDLSGTGAIWDEGYKEGEFSFVYSMQNANQGTGTVYMRDYYNQLQQVPFTFTLVGTTLYVTATIEGRQTTMNFVKQ